MIKFTNRLTGGVMWVAEERAEEYKAAGHKPAASSEAKKPASKPKKKAKKEGTEK